MRHTLILTFILSTVAGMLLLSREATKKQAEDRSNSHQNPVTVETPSAPMMQQNSSPASSPLALVSNELSIRELLKKGKIEAAIARLEEILRKNPADEIALRALAALYMGDGRHRDKVASLLRKALESNPENREVLEKYLSLQHDDKRPGSPLEALRRLMEDNPDSPNIAGAYARSLGAKGQYAEAIALLERALENPRADDLAFESLSEYYRKIGQPERAAETFERAVRRQEELLSDLKSRNLPTADLERSILSHQSILARELLQGRQYERVEALIHAIASRDPNYDSLTWLREQLERGRRS